MRTGRVCSNVFYAALRTAARAEEHLRNGGDEADLTDYGRASKRFSTELQHAMAKAESPAVDAIRRAGSEGGLEPMTTRTRVGMDDDSQPIFVAETTVTERPPDWRAQAWWLERKRTLGGSTPLASMGMTRPDGALAAQLQYIAGTIKGDIIPADRVAIEVMKAGDVAASPNPSVGCWNSWSPGR